MAHILIVEDDEKTREAMTDYLESIGHQVIEAADGEAGLQQALAQKPQLILLDFSLPKMHGWAVAREIRKDPSMQNTAIVALTAHVMVATEDTAMDVGCDAYLTKPISLDDFEPWLQQFLAQRGIS